MLLPDGKTAGDLSGRVAVLPGGVMEFDAGGLSGEARPLIHAFNFDIDMHLRKNESKGVLSSAHAGSGRDDSQIQIVNERAEEHLNDPVSPQLKSATDGSSQEGQAEIIKFFHANQNCIDQQLKPLSPFSSVRWKQLDLGKLDLVDKVTTKECDQPQKDAGAGPNEEIASGPDATQRILTDRIQDQKKKIEDLVE